MTEIINSVPTFWNEGADFDRLNTLLDEITAKRFVSPTIFVQGVRGALDLFGITLPHMDIEGTDGGVSPVESPYILRGLTDPANPAFFAPPTEGEFVFQVKDGTDDDEDDIYLYMVADRDAKGLYECYAQVVNGDELEMILSAPDEELPAAGAIPGAQDGESVYDTQVRHAGVDQIAPV